MSVLRSILRLLVVALWLLVLALACETYEIIHSARAVSRSERIRVPLYEAIRARDDAAIEATASIAPRLPSWARLDLPSRDVFPLLDETGRLEFARTRCESILSCDGEGWILGIYPYRERDELSALAKSASVGKPLSCVFPPSEAADAMKALRHTYTTRQPQSREYVLSLPGFPKPYVCSVSFCVVCDTSGTPTGVLVCAHDSKYEVMNTKYRKHIYKNSRLDPLFPQFVHSEFWTNNMGYRGDDIAIPKLPRTFRILCIGGSTTVEGPRNDLTYPGLLQNRLREYFHTNAIEVVNAGVDAASTGELLANIPDYLAVQPDLVIDYAFANDAQAVRNLASRQMPPFKRSLMHSAFLYRLMPRFFLPARTDVEDALKKVTLANERGILEAVRSQGCEMALCSLAYPDFAHLAETEANLYDSRYCRVAWGGMFDAPTYVYLADTYNAKAREFCEREGTLYIPVSENLKGGVDYFADIAHLHLAGIERKADIVFEHLKGPLESKLKSKGILPESSAAP